MQSQNEQYWGLTPSLDPELARFYYKPQYSSPQYSQTFAEWMVEQYHADSDFYAKAREAAKKLSV